MNRSAIAGRQKAVHTLDTEEMINVGKEVIGEQNIRVLVHVLLLQGKTYVTRLVKLSEAKETPEWLR